MAFRYDVLNLGELIIDSYPGNSLVVLNDNLDTPLHIALNDKQLESNKYKFEIVKKLIEKNT